MIDPLDPDVEVLPMSNALHAALSGIWPDLTKAERQRVAEAVTQEQAAVIRELRADLERAEAEADRLDEALATIAGISTATVMIDPALPLRIARAALDAEEDER